MGIVLVPPGTRTHHNQGSLQQLPRADLSANRGILNQIANNELSTEMYPFIADSPLALLGWDPERASFLPALPPTGLTYEERTAASTTIPEAYPSIDRRDIAAATFYPGSLTNRRLKEHHQKYPWRLEAIKRWGLENDLTDRMYVFTDKDEFLEDQESFSRSTYDIKDHPRTYRAILAAHESGHRGLEKILELYPQLRKELKAVTNSDSIIETIQRLVDLESYHGDKEQAIDWLKDKFPDNYKEKARAIKLKYLDPINELAKVLLEKQGRSANLRPGEDFVKLWEPEKKQTPVGTLESLANIK